MAAAVPMPLAPLWLQGATYPADTDRTLLDVLFVEGVAESGDLKVSQRAAGTNMSVDVAVGSGFVEGDPGAGTRGYLFTSDTVTNVPMDAAPASNSRIDIIVAQVQDNTVGGGGQNRWVLQSIAGTPSATPVAPATPSNAVKLAEVRVASSVAAVTNALIDDKRAPMRRLSVATAASRLPVASPGALQVLTDTGRVERAVGGSWVDLAAGGIEVVAGNQVLFGTPQPVDTTRWKLVFGQKAVAFSGGHGKLVLPIVLTGVAFGSFIVTANVQGITVNLRTAGTDAELDGNEIPLTAYSTNGSPRSGVSDEISYMVLGW